MELMQLAGRKTAAKGPVPGGSSLTASIPVRPGPTSTTGSATRLRMRASPDASCSPLSKRQTFGREQYLACQCHPAYVIKWGGIDQIAHIMVGPTRCYPLFGKHATTGVVCG
jgi:hypothetical protein